MRLVRRGHRLQSFERSLLQSFAMVGVGNLNQLVGSLAQRLAKQIRDSVLRDNIVHVGSRRHHTGTCME